ncbi:zinc finger MYM-type 1-like, partial [Brachionus plicatilis]
MFCLPCFLFYKESTNEKKICSSKEFCLYGSNNWINGLKTVSNHEKSKCHIDSCVAYGEFKKTNISEKISENYSLYRKSREEKINSNRNILHRIIDLEILCAKNYLAFRGSDAKYYKKNHNILEKKRVPVPQNLVTALASYTQLHLDRPQPL